MLLKSAVSCLLGVLFLAALAYASYVDALKSKRSKRAATQKAGSLVDERTSSEEQNHEPPHQAVGPDALVDEALAHNN